MGKFKQVAAKILRGQTKVQKAFNVIPAAVGAVRETVKAISSSVKASDLDAVAKTVAEGKKFERILAEKNGQSPATFAGTGKVALGPLTSDAGKGKYGAEYYGTRSRPVIDPSRPGYMLQTSKSAINEWSKKEAGTMRSPRTTGAQMLRQEMNSSKATLTTPVKPMIKQAPLFKKATPDQAAPMIRDAKEYMRKRGLTGDYRNYMEAAHIEATKAQARPVKD